MNRDQVIATLREREPEVKAAGVLRLSVFGSTARGDRRPDSDVDLQAAFTQDLKTNNAAERCLERISEAAQKLGDVAESL